VISSAGQPEEQPDLKKPTALRGAVGVWDRESGDRIKGCDGHDYELALEDAFKHTDHAKARWDLIAAESKHFARVKVLETVISRMEEGMRRWGIEPPPSIGADFGA